MNNNSVAEPAATFETALGGRDLTVSKVDGGTELVKVRQLAVRALPRYLLVFEDEARSVELFCDKPESWADTLTPASFVEVLKIGEELNLDFLAGYAARMQSRREKVMPGIQEQFLTRLLSQLPNTSPASLPKPG